MAPPIRCYTCGKVIGRFFQQYTEMLETMNEQQEKIQQQYVVQSNNTINPKKRKAIDETQDALPKKKPKHCNNKKTPLLKVASISQSTISKKKIGVKKILESTTKKTRPRNSYLENDSQSKNYFVEQKSAKVVLETLGITRYCCKRMFTTYVPQDEELLKYEQVEELQQKFSDHPIDPNIQFFRYATQPNIIDHIR